MRAKLVVLEVGGDLERNFGRGTYDKRGRRERIFEREREKKKDTPIFLIWVTYSRNTIANGFCVNNRLSSIGTKNRNGGLFNSLATRNNVHGGNVAGANHIRKFNLFSLNYPIYQYGLRLNRQYMPEKASKRIQDRL